MPLTVNSLGVVTICLVCLLLLIGLICILYTFHLRSCILNSSSSRLSSFNGPWFIRITFILYGIWWGFGEIVRLSLLRREGRFSLKWQENMCKYYVLLNFGFAEPCLFLTLTFLLRSSLQWKASLGSLSGTLSQQWNGKTCAYILLYCTPFFILDLIVVTVGPKFPKINPYFTATYHHSKEDENVIALCSYPLLSTLLHGFLVSVLTMYLLLLGKRLVSSIINKVLERRVYTLILLVSSFLPSRVIMLGFSVLSSPSRLVFEAIAFSSFLLLLSCVVLGIFTLVYSPVADSLALKSCLLVEECNDSGLLLVQRISDASTKRGSISFRTMIKDDALSTATSPEMTIEEELC